MRPVQYFTRDYLERCRCASAESVLAYLESFRQLELPAARTRLISLKVEEALLNGFKQQCALRGLRYQTQIKRLMREWLRASA